MLNRDAVRDGMRLFIVRMSIDDLGGRPVETGHFGPMFPGVFPGRTLTKAPRKHRACQLRDPPEEDDGNACFLWAYSR